MRHAGYIVREFNDRFGNIEWKDQDKIEQVIAEELPAALTLRYPLLVREAVDEPL